MKDIEHYKRAIAKGMDRGYWVGVLQMLGLSDDCGTKNLQNGGHAAVVTRKIRVCAVCSFINAPVLNCRLH